MHDTAGYINDITGGQIDAAIFHHQIATAFHNHHRAIVNPVHVRLFPVTDLHDVMAHALSLAEGRDLDVFADAERVLGQYFFDFGLFEFCAVLEGNSRRRGTGEGE